MLTFTVFSRAGCAPCVALKHFLKTKGVEFTEKSVDDDPAARTEAMRLSGQMTLPVTLVEEIKEGWDRPAKFVYTGYNPGRLAELIANS